MRIEDGSVLGPNMRRVFKWIWTKDLALYNYMVAMEPVKAQEYAHERLNINPPVYWRWMRREDYGQWFIDNAIAVTNDAHSR